MSDLNVIFEKEEFQKTKCIELAKNYDNALTLEAISVRQYSPGIVQDSENIARQIFSPIHLDKDNKVNAAFFNDAFDKGLSTNRMQIKSISDIHAAGENTAKRIRDDRDPERAYFGFVSAITGDIRAIFEEGNQRVYCVYDSGLQLDPSHADVCMIRPENPPGMNSTKKAIKIERRRYLQEAFQKVPVTLAPAKK